MGAARKLPSSTTIRYSVAGAAVVGVTLLAGLGVSARWVRDMSAVFLSLVLEGVPFLLLGSLVASVVQEFVSPRFLTRISRRLGAAGIPVVALSGFAFPICECAIVPTVRRLRGKGLDSALAMTFLVSVPLVNPVVIASTVAAFSDRPSLILARFLGGFAVAVIVGLVFYLRDRRDQEENADPGESGDQLDPSGRNSAGGARVARFIEHSAIEFVEVFGYFAAGALVSAAAKVLVPSEVMLLFRANLVLSILVMIVFAYMLSVCSEADAFIGRAFIPLIGEPAVLAFLVFGPMLDLKNTLLLRRTLSAGEFLVFASVLTASVTCLGVCYGLLIS